ncbi:MAG: phage shock protein C [Pseudohongiellaceae bacterium]|jgi:phage shock protein C
MSSTVNSGFSKLHRNKENARWLGVCAGVADWLEIPAALVRVIFVICVFAWPTLAIGYFILYFCLSDESNSESLKDYLKNNKTTDHFKKINYRKPIYKNMRKKRIAGVCAGLADYLEVSPLIVRVLTLGSLFILGPFTFWAYIICIFVLEPDPATVEDDYWDTSWRGRRQKRKASRRERRAAKDQRYATGYENLQTKTNMSAGATNSHASNASKPSQASADECSHAYKQMEKRLRSIEAYMTSKRFRLHCEINRI